jgi:hypothetical protein
MTEPDLLQALRDCYLPTRQNIVTAGLVRSATLELDPTAPGASIPGNPPRFIARVTLHAPTNDEAATAQLHALVENRLLGIAAIHRVELTLLPALFPIL